MPYQNITGGINNLTRDEILQKLDEVQALMPFLVNLAKTEKRRGFKMGKKTEKFLYDVQQIISVQPQMLPIFISKADFDSDLTQLIILQAIELRLKSLHEAVADTRAAFANECVHPGLAIYKNIKSAAQSNVPGADSSLQLLQPYFKKTRKKKK